MGLGFLNQIEWSPNPCRFCTPESKFRTRHARGSGCATCRGTGYGPQLNALVATVDEPFIGGPRGWGKSDVCQVWVLSGNPLEEDGPLRRVKVKHRGVAREITTGGVHYSYVFQPDYKALVTRKTEDDLDAWISAFRPRAEAMGARFIGRPDYCFRFPDEDGVPDEGGVINLSHLKDPNSYMKYQGQQQFHRWQPEEVAQIPDEETFENVLTCMRTSFEGKFRVQVMPTANPEGPGVVWVADRWVNLKDRNGDPIPPGTPVVFKARDLLTGREVQRTRMFITGTLLDNPRVHPSYIANLNMISDPRRRRALLLGTWDLAQGNFFTEWREKRLEGEPENACHVYPAGSVEVKPWWRCTIGLDWGYAHNAAATFGFTDPDTGRLLVDDELVVNMTGARRLGELVAQKALPILQRAAYPTIDLYLSHETFGRRNEEGGVTRIAKQIEQGIRSVLGPDAVSSPDLELHEMADANDMEYSEFIQKYADIKKSVEDKKRYGIVIHRAMVSHEHGWALLHEMLRWQDDLEAEVPEFDWKTWQRLGAEVNGYAATEYLKSFSPKTRVMPELMISSDCVNVLRGFRGARTHPKKPEAIDDKHYEGRDSLDSCFVAGTLVSCAGGPRPIENIEVGDVVWTRSGLRTVLHVERTENRPVWEVETEFGSRLVGTPNHPVLVVDKGWCSIDTLSYGDHLCRLKSSYTKETDTTVILDRTEGRDGATSLRPGTPAQKVTRNTYTGESGKITTGRYQKDSTSTIRTGILSTTKSITSRLSRLATTAVCMLRNLSNSAVSTWTLFARWQRSGMLPKPVENGIPRTPRRPGANENQYYYSANCADRSSSPSTAGQLSSAATTASQRLGGSQEPIESRSCAPTAESRSGPTSTTRPRVVLDRVLRSYATGRRETVYNLQVETDEEFFANGILVHNCRYLCCGERGRTAGADLPYAEKVSRHLAQLKEHRPDITQHQINQAMEWAEKMGSFHSKREVIRGRLTGRRHARLASRA